MQRNIRNINNIGIIKNWNKFLNNRICLVFTEHKHSNDMRKHFCKVLIDKNIYTVPKKNIELID